MSGHVSRKSLRGMAAHGRLQPEIRANSRLAASNPQNFPLRPFNL